MCSAIHTFNFACCRGTVLFVTAVFCCSDNVGREVISRFTTSLQSNAAFYIDANGREILPRM